MDGWLGCKHGRDSYYPRRILYGPTIRTGSCLLPRLNIRGATAAVVYEEKDESGENNRRLLVFLYGSVLLLFPFFLKKMEVVHLFVCWVRYDFSQKKFIFDCIFIGIQDNFRDEKSKQTQIFL